MERPIDTHEVRRTKVVSERPNKINQWRDAWIACYDFVSDWQTIDLKNFHYIFEKWVPLINLIFGNQIKLSRYNTSFYYIYDLAGPKEVLHLYVDNSLLQETHEVYVLFNLHAFQKIQRQYCQDQSRSQHMLVNEARGTVNLNHFLEHESNPAEYFRIMTTWQLLFVYTVHLLSHWDTFDKYDHSDYENHVLLRESPFHKLHFYGQMVRTSY